MVYKASFSFFSFWSGWDNAELLLYDSGWRPSDNTLYEWLHDSGWGAREKG